MNGVVINGNFHWWIYCAHAVDSGREFICFVTQRNATKQMTLRIGRKEKTKGSNLYFHYSFRHHEDIKRSSFSISTFWHRLIQNKERRESKNPNQRRCEKKVEDRKITDQRTVKGWKKYTKKRKKDIKIQAGGNIHSSSEFYPKFWRCCILSLPSKSMETYSHTRTEGREVTKAGSEREKEKLRRLKKEKTKLATYFNAEHRSK